MSRRILIVGATGFLGASVAQRLRERQPIAMVRKTSDRSVLPDDLEIRVGALENAALPLDGVSTLVYCASMGFGHIPSLLALLANSSVRRAVFVSTTAIFTSLPSASRAVRLEAEAAVQSSHLDWTILRPTMIYGAARDRNMSRLLRYLRRWPVFPLCGDALWQPVHVEDAADAVVAALDEPHTVRGVYNIPGGDPLRFSALVRTAAQAVGRRRVVLVPVPVSAAVIAARLTHVVTPEQIRRLAEDKAFAHTEATRDFNYTPRPFAEGITQEAQSLGLGASIPQQKSPRGD